ncbi:MAG TPA: TraR/DksA C4-type zinc finger protein [Rhodospirillales bacterium]|jgi:RNA polymerase-binding transcription factor DksA|nr:TraR/DksA C4-type zinc finger protein [Rhodospirillales bacterium]
MQTAREIDAELKETPNPDFEENATEMEGDEVLERLGQAALTEIGQIKAALERINNGVYGTCSTCGEPVGEARLDAVPHAAQCMDCLES